MDLLAETELQPVFDGSQELICARQFMKVPAGDVVLVMQLLQREHRPAGAQPWFLATIHALQTLHEKLDIANASAIELHIERLCTVCTVLRDTSLAERGSGARDRTAPSARLNLLA